MPILRVDQFGRIYESSPDREDGLGYKGHATPVSQGDLTLGSAYAKSNKALNEQVMREKRLRKAEDAQAAQQREVARRKAMANRIKAASDQKLRDNESYQNYLKGKAISMGCPCTLDNKLSGNGLTANGRTGIAGMSRDQQAIHRAYHGMGVDASYNIPNTEVRNREQHNSNLRSAALKQQAQEQKLRLQSKRGK